MSEETKENLKKLLVADENITNNFLIALLYGFYKDEAPEEYETFLLDNYEAYDYLISQNEDIKKSLSEVFNDMISDTMINDTINTYSDLADNEAKQLIYSVSRLLFIQDKYKDDEIGQEIDSRIKEWLDYIRYYDEKEINKILDPHNKKVGSEDYTLALNKMSAKIFHQTIPSLNYDIYNTREPKRAFMSLWNDQATSNDLKGFINNFINNKIEDGKTRERYINKFHNLINDTLERKQISNFENTYAKEIQKLRDIPKKDIIQDKQSIDLKNSILMCELSDERKGQNKVLDELVHDTFINSVYELYSEYQKTKEYQDLEQTQEDVIIWRSKADNFIKHLINYDGIALIGLFTMDYMLDYLAYNDYQRETYKLDLEDDIKVIKEFKKSDKIVTQTAQKGSSTAPKKAPISKASKEEIEKVTKKKSKDNYLTNSTPTNRAILDTYGAYTGIETNSIEKIITKIKSIEDDLKKAKTTGQTKDLKSELELLNKKKITLEQTQKELIKEISEAKQSLREAKEDYEKKEIERVLSNDDRKAYNNLIETLSSNVIEKETELKDFNNKGIVFRGNLFNELEYTDDKGRTIASLKNQNGEILEAKDIPTLAEAFLRLTNDHYYNRLDNYNTFKDKIDTLFPKTKGTTYRIANETIKRNLGKNGYIIDLKELINILHVSDNNLRHYSDNIQETIRFFNNIQISVQQQDKLTKNDDVLNMFFGITNNVYASRQIKGNIYIYYEISSVYETILDNSQNPTIAQNPIVLLKYATGQNGNKRVFKVGDYLFNDLRRSLNNGVSGIKINKKGEYYKRYKVKTLLKPLRESKLITETKARKGKYRDDVFNKFIATLGALEKENLIKYNLYFDDDVKLSSDIFKSTFENTFVDITFTYTIEEYENILSKNISNKKNAHITNASNYVLTFGKYQGKTIKEVYDTDKQYLEYVLNTPELKINKPKITRQHIKNYLDHKKNLETLKDKKK